MKSTHRIHGLTILEASEPASEHMSEAESASKGMQGMSRTKERADKRGAKQATERADKRGAKQATERYLAVGSKIAHAERKKDCKKEKKISFKLKNSKDEEMKKKSKNHTHTQTHTHARFR